ncbi:RNA polymerase sigma factor [Luteolibacter sp. Populi]|uniref:RNA polymerase sigma factor n=1 Tax=Luteolibacter sp. Populi TaxID=3230487 RepID=UPI003466A5EA
MNIFQRFASNPVLGPAGTGGAAAGTPGEAAEPDDETLVLRAQAGDMRAYDELVTRHRGRIYAMIRNMVKNDTDAWDLSQEAFIKAWQALPRFEAKARFTTWLYRIAHNCVYDFTRRRRPESGGDEINDELLSRERIDPAAIATPAEARSPDEALAGDELRAKIEAALEKLSPEHREAVILKDVQGLAYKEIAEVMSCSLGTVMSRLFYARQKLQSLLKDEYDAR